MDRGGISSGVTDGRRSRTGVDRLVLCNSGDGVVDLSSSRFRDDDLSADLSGGLGAGVDAGVGAAVAGDDVRRICCFRSGVGAVEGGA